MMPQSSTFRSGMTFSILGSIMMSTFTVSATRFFNYESKNIVSDQASVDKDFRDMIAYMDERTPEAFHAAKMLYDHGAHSKTYASLSLVDVDGIGGPFFGGNTIRYGTKVTGYTENGHKVIGSVLEDLHGGNDKKEMHLLFQYPVHDDLENHVDCQKVLAPTKSRRQKITAGCLAESGTITVDMSSEGDGQTVTYDMNYAYNTTSDNLSGRSFYGLSRDAEATMLSCSHGCPHPFFFKFYSYYDRPDFADNFIHSAFNGKSTDLANGNQNFNNTELSGRAEAIELGTLGLTMRPFVVRGMELSLSKCYKGCGDDNNDCDIDKQIHGWDQAVAYYTGSLERGRGEHSDGVVDYNDDQSWGEGYLLYNYADTMCRKFGTCGFDGRDNRGTSLVNYQIFKLFEEGQTAILDGRCDDAKATKRRIVQLMSVPAIQSLLRVSYHLNKEGTDPERRIVSKGAALASAIVPLVHICNATDARIIYENMKIEKTIHIQEDGKATPRTTKHKQVKEALERSYDCLGLTCKDIGGLLNDQEETDEGRKYMPGAIPCMRAGHKKEDIDHTIDLKKYASQLEYSKNSSNDTLRTIAVVTITTSILVFCVSVALLYFMRANVFCCRRSEKEFEGQEDSIVTIGRSEVDIEVVEDYNDVVLN